MSDWFNDMPDALVRIIEEQEASLAEEQEAFLVGTDADYVISAEVA